MLPCKFQTAVPGVCVSEITDLIRCTILFASYDNSLYIVHHDCCMYFISLNGLANLLCNMYVTSDLKLQPISSPSLVVLWRLSLVLVSRRFLLYLINFTFKSLLL